MFNKNRFAVMLSHTQYNIEQRIYTIRETSVMIDFHIAELYGIETKRLNEQVKRNSMRFPDEFMFQLSKSEWQELQSQIATANDTGNLQSQIATAKRRSLPYAFSEQGVAMLSAVLHTPTAITTSIKIIKAFVSMRRFLTLNACVFQRLNNLEKMHWQTEEKIERIFRALDYGHVKNTSGLFFDGQIFDAYTFVSKLVRSAQSSIILIDNYIDETVFTLLDKRIDGVSATIYTKVITREVLLDLKRHNAQYPPIVISTFSQSHDRFLIIDQKVLFHIGASLKDLGKKWFGFSQMSQDLLLSLLSKLK
jgi:hypothetical protein